MDDKKLPLAVGGGTVLLVGLAAVFALSDDSGTVAETTAGNAGAAVIEAAGDAVDGAAEAADATAGMVADAVEKADLSNDVVVAEAETGAEAETRTELETEARLADAAPADTGEGFDLSALSPAQQAAFGAQVRAYLLDNPQVIMEAVAVLEEREAAEQAEGDVALVENNREALIEDGYSFVGGNPEGDLTIVEFLDYRCGYCRRAHPEVEELVQSDGNIRLIVKEFPILGEASMVSSRFAIATLITEGPEAYKAIHDALVTLEGDPTEPVLERLANTLGLDVDAILAEMGSDEVTRRISETRELAQAMRISGTPTFVFGDRMLRGYAPLDAMRQLVEEQREG